MIFLTLFIILIVALVLWIYTTMNYWKRRKIPYVKGEPIFGNIRRGMLQQTTVAENLSEIYNNSDAKDQPFVGMNIFHTPALMIKDPELIKRILIRDFHTFQDRHTKGDQKSDSFGYNILFMVRNPVWKTMRARLTPFFRSAHMKQMFHIMHDISQNLNKFLLSTVVDSSTNSCAIELKDICSRYTIDVIASCALGVSANAIENPNSEFKQHGKAIFEGSPLRAFELYAFYFLPQIVPLLKLKMFSEAASNFLRKITLEVMAEREKSGINRGDLIDQLILLKNEDINVVSDDKQIAFKGDVLAAQGGAFFAAGFESSSSAISFCLYELAYRMDYQKRLRKELQEMLIKSNGILTYENIEEVQTLNWAVSETMRLYPSLPLLDRECLQDYSLVPFNDFVIPKGMPIFIPLYPINRDPNLFPNPNSFQPERFSPENKSKIKPYTFMPFGDGPRMCIGERFALMQVKLGLINILRNHYVEPNEKTIFPMKFQKSSLFLDAEGGIYLNLVRDIMEV